MRTSDNMKGTLADIASLVKDEFKTISTSYAILLVLVGGIFLYGLLYNYMYAPDLVRNAPVVVVDDSKTDLSREYIRLLNATPQVSVIADGLDYAEAQEWMKEGDAVGILYLPSDFETRVARGNESLFIMYQTTSAFLYYMAMQEASSGAMLALNDRYRPEMLVFLPQQDASKIVSAQPISVVGTALYNFTEGYGTYLIPAVLIVIMFQTLLMVIGMISGEERDSGTIVRFASEGLSFGRIARVIISKTFVYCVLYTIFALFLLGLIPLLFGLPDIGNYLNTLILLIPFLAGYQLLWAGRLLFLYGLGGSVIDDRLLLGRLDLPFRSLLSLGIDALVLANGPLYHSGGSRYAGLCTAQLDGSVD